jgi:hypothetical protein
MLLAATLLLILIIAKKKRKTEKNQHLSTLTPHIAIVFCNVG